MSDTTAAHSWFGAEALALPTGAPEDSDEFSRLWTGFMTARLVLGFVLVLLQGGLYAMGSSHNPLLAGICIIYFAGTLVTRLVVRPRPLGSSFSRRWGALVGMDLLAFSALQLLQDTSTNYTPLFALPILLTAVLGSLRLALGTAAGVIVLFLGGNLWTYLGKPSDPTPYFVQSALSGIGYFVIAFLANQLALRLANERQRARVSQLAASIQRQVNELVIESLADGVLIVDDRARVRAANPAARMLLGSELAQRAAVFDLKDEPGWLPLADLARMSLGTGKSQEADVVISHAGHGPRRIHARTRMALTQGTGQENLCVLFLQDQRELEARMRTEKLASMGRMSTAVAHEIRNPLAAIAQANALLEEDIAEPHLKKLTMMVGQNAKRLEKIVDDILNVARVQPHEKINTLPMLALNETVDRIARDWAQQNGVVGQIQLHLGEAHVLVRFDPEHLRRVLVNLLDNACRYASMNPHAIQIHSAADGKEATLSVWSDGAPMDQSVERHLFEPFFSSESRSSGLGLYICRELCERNGASILYLRNIRAGYDGPTEGNEFVVTLMRDNAQQMQDNPATPWQTTLY